MGHRRRGSVTNLFLGGSSTLDLPVTSNAVAGMGRSSQFLQSSGAELPSAAGGQGAAARASAATAASRLHGRLEEMLIFELTEDGGREFLNLSVRGLYRYVIESITHSRSATTAAISKAAATSMTTKEPLRAPPPPGKSRHQRHHSVGSAVGGGASSSGNKGSSNVEDDSKQVSFNREVTVQLQGPTGDDAPVLETITQDLDDVGNGDDAAGAAGAADVTYRERLGGYLHPRDMRRLVTPFSASNEPELIVRRHVMLLNFDPLRAIILRDRLLILVPEGADSLLITIEKRVRGGLEHNMEYSYFESESAAGSAPPSEVNSVEGDISNHTANRQSPCNSDSGKDGGDEEDKLSQYSHNTEGSSGGNRHHNPIGRILGHGTHRRSAGDGEPDVSHHSSPGTHHRGIVSKIKHSIASSHKSTASASSDKSLDEEAEEDNQTISTQGDEMYPEWEEMNNTDWIDLPFELQCADAVLYVVCSILSDDTYRLKDSTLGYIGSVLSGQYGLSDDPLSGLRHTKDAIHEMDSRVKGFVKSMNRILDEDEDLALMNLSRLM